MHVHTYTVTFTSSFEEMGKLHQRTINYSITIVAIVETMVIEDFMYKMKQKVNFRCVLFSKLSCPEFDQLNDQNKFCYMLTRPNVARIVGQFIIDAFDDRPVKV